MIRDIYYKYKPVVVDITKAVGFIGILYFLVPWMFTCLTNVMPAGEHQISTVEQLLKDDPDNYKEIINAATQDKFISLNEYTKISKLANEIKLQQMHENSKPSEFTVKID